MDHPVLLDHWWPRPGWRLGRLTYTWHLTFEDAPDLHRLVTAYQDALRPLPGLHPVPPPWLHLTMQSVGFDDEVDRADLDAATAAVRSALGQLAPFALTFDRPHILGEAIAMLPTPAAPVVALYHRIRRALGDAMGAEAVPIAPEQVDGFLPHVTVAHSSINTEAAPYVDALDAAATAPAQVTVRAAHLIRQERLLAPDWLYRWDPEASAALAG